MKFATIALMAVAMFTADAEAHKKRVVTAECLFPKPDVASMVRSQSRLGDYEEDDAIMGGFYLTQKYAKYDRFKYIDVSGKIWNAEKKMDYSAQLYDHAACGFDASGATGGDVIKLRDRRSWKRSTQILRGKVGDGGDDQVLLTDWTGKSIALVNDSFVTVACCPISEIVDHSSEESEARLLEDMFDQN